MTYLFKILIHDTLTMTPAGLCRKFFKKCFEAKKGPYYGVSLLLLILKGR